MVFLKKVSIGFGDYPELVGPILFIRKKKLWFGSHKAKLRQVSHSSVLAVLMWGS